jgi:hypothetical protein
MARHQFSVSSHIDFAICLSKSSFIPGKAPVKNDNGCWDVPRCDTVAEKPPAPL